MTVKELFQKEGFSAIMTAMRHTHKHEPSTIDSASYTESYDELCNTVPEPNDGVVTFDVSPRDKWESSHWLPLLANNVEGDYWEQIVAREVIRPEDNPFTDAELAGAILWGATFYGFTRRSSIFWNREPISKYGIRAAQLRIKMDLPYFSSKQTQQMLKKRIKENPSDYALPMEDWDSKHIRMQRLNRSKRKRIYRIEQRAKWLENLEMRVRLIQSLRTFTGEQLGEIAAKIMDAETIYDHWRESHVAGKSDRVSYLIDLNTYYAPTLTEYCQDYGEEVLVLVLTGKSYPISLEEETRLHQQLEQELGSIGLRWQILKGVDDKDTSELSLQFVCIKNKEKKNKNFKCCRKNRDIVRLTL